MVPWKMFVRSASAVALLTVGAMAAGQSVPFSNVSRGVSPSVEVDETPAEEEAPDVDPAAEVDTTADDAPDSAPVTAAPELEDPAPVDPPVVDGRELKVKTVKPAEAPAAPKAKKDPKVKKDCRVTHPSKGDHNGDGHCDNGWHNKNAEWLADKADKAGRPDVTDVDQADVEGDHNGDGRKDNGWHNKDGHPGRAPKGDRPETAPGQLKK